MRTALVRTDRYSRVAIAFHWMIAALLLFNLWLGLFHEGLPREWRVIPVHKSVGLTVLVLSLARLGWRLAHRPPLLAPGGAPWERWAALAAHRTLYAVMIVLPLTGWAMSSVGREGGAPRPLSWFFLFDVPYLPVTRGVADVAHAAHVFLGYAMTALVALHIAAALRHHLILRDATLARMLPLARRVST